MSDKTRWIICGLLAMVLIGMGLFQAITGIELNRQIMHHVELGVMLGVLYFLVIYPKNKKRNEELEKNEIELEEIQEELALEEELDEEATR